MKLCEVNFICKSKGKVVPVHGMKAEVIPLSCYRFGSLSGANNSDIHLLRGWGDPRRKKIVKYTPPPKYSKQVILGFRCSVNEIFALLGFYTA